MKNRSKKIHIFIIAAFFILLLLPLTENILNFAPQIHFGEKRAPRPFPKIDKSDPIKSLNNFPKDFESFFGDNFGLRKHIITANNFIIDKIFNTIDSDKVIKGKGKWLFTSEDYTIADCHQNIRFTKKELEITTRELVKNWNNLKENNIEYLFIITPDKQSIHPEFLPNNIQKGCKSGNRRADQLIDHILKQRPDFPILDLRKALIKRKAAKLKGFTKTSGKTLNHFHLYHKTDTHWNEYGAHIAYRTIINHPSASSLTQTKHLFKNLGYFTIKKEEYSGDLAQITNLNQKEEVVSITDPTPPYKMSDITTIEKKRLINNPPEKYLTTSIHKNKSLPSALIFHDSFMDDLKKFLSYHFKKVTYINNKALKDAQKHNYLCLLNINLAKNLKTDIVIQQTVERKLYKTIAQCIDNYKDSQ